MNVSWMIPLLSQPCVRFVSGAQDIRFPGAGGWAYEEAIWAGKKCEEDRVKLSWMVPDAPKLKYEGSTQDIHFPGTGGWTCEEAAWAGAQSRGVVFEVATFLPRSSDILVISPEAQALSALSGIRSFRAGKILVRVVGRPKPVQVWDDIAKIAPEVYSWCCIGQAEAVCLREWLKGLGLPQRVFVVPLGAETAPPDFDPSKRSGIAYLGSAHHQKQVPVVVEAAALAGVPLHLGLSMTNEAAAEDLQNIGTTATKTGAKITVGEYGIEARARLLSSVRAVVTASYTDNQWLPGTEARARGAIAIASDVQLPTWGIREANGDGMMYFDPGTAKKLAERIRQYVLDDAAWEKEARRQHAAFIDSGMTSSAVGAALWGWVKAAMEDR